MEPVYIKNEKAQEALAFFIEYQKELTSPEERALVPTLRDLEKGEAKGSGYKRSELQVLEVPDDVSDESDELMELRDDTESKFGVYMPDQI